MFLQISVFVTLSKRVISEITDEERLKYFLSTVYEPQLTEICHARAKSEYEYLDDINNKEKLQAMVFVNFCAGPNW